VIQISNLTVIQFAVFVCASGRFVGSFCYIYYNY